MRKSLRRSGFDDEDSHDARNRPSRAGRRKPPDTGIDEQPRHAESNSTDPSNLRRGIVAGAAVLTLFAVSLLVPVTKTTERPATPTDTKVETVQVVHTWSNWVMWSINAEPEVKQEFINKPVSLEREDGEFTVRGTERSSESAE